MAKENRIEQNEIEIAREFLSFLVKWMKEDRKQFEVLH